MSLLAAVVIVGPAALLAWLEPKVRAWRGRRAAPVLRKPPGRRYVDLPGFPQPLEHRDPGTALNAVDDHAVWHDAADELGRFEPHPETAPYPGPLVAEPGDVEDLLTGVIRHLRAHAHH